MKPSTIDRAGIAPAIETRRPRGRPKQEAKEPAPDYVAIAPARLTAWREGFGWSGAEAARQLGLSRNGLAAYEAGEFEGRPRPAPKWLALACAAISAKIEPLK